MHATYSATTLRHTVAPAQCVASLFRRFWDAFQERRRRPKLRATLIGRSDRELIDLGTTRGEIDYVASARERSGPHYSTRLHVGSALFVLLLCSQCVFFAPEADAQCTAQDVLRNRLALKEAAPAPKSQTPVRSALDVPVWKTISVGTFSNTFDLRGALDAGGCGVGDTAGEILARPAFTLNATRTDVELFTVSATELGIQTETASLGQIYSRAQQLGFELAIPEIGPQLRLQYLDQPIGEFLIVGMEPIKTWDGKPVILTVVNGGAGLLLVGQDGHLTAELSAASRFLFVRSTQAAPATAARIPSDIFGLTTHVQ